MFNNFRLDVRAVGKTLRVCFSQELGRARKTNVEPNLKAQFFLSSSPLRGGKNSVVRRPIFKSENGQVTVPHSLIGKFSSPRVRILFLKLKVLSMQRYEERAYLNFNFQEIRILCAGSPALPRARCVRFDASIAQKSFS